MKSKIVLVFGSMLLATVFLAACTAALGSMADQNSVVNTALPGESTSEAMQDSTSEDGMLHQDTTDPTLLETMIDEQTQVAITKEASPEAMMDDSITLPDWFSIPLTDVRNGKQFSIKDLKGKVVLVETMAMWCTNCFKQQKQVLELHDLLGESDDFVSLGLDIDPNEMGEALQAYTEMNGFFWMYAISPPEVSREIGLLYGDQFLNPPSTPMLIIDRHRQVRPLPFGIKDTQSLMEALQPFLEEGM
ncbi:MAG: TlpA family protein disulfide reductase [Anaerolineales bacterium]